MVLITGKACRMPATLVVGVVAVFCPKTAEALDPEVQSDTAAQFYSVRSPTGETLLSRRRLTTSLGVGGYNLLDHVPSDTRAPELVFRARLRYDADYGARRAESDAQQADDVVPGFQQTPVDLMYAYIEGRRFAGGWLGFKLGRQYITDALGWWSFDGASVRATTPFYAAVEGYAGFEQRGGLPLSNPRYERDGVWRGDRADFGPALYPAFQPATVAPAVGGVVETTGLTWMHARASYRRVTNTGQSNGPPFPSAISPPITVDGSRLSSERVGLGFDLNPPPTMPQVLGFKAGLTHDLLVSKVATIFGSIDAFVTNKLTLSVDYDYYRPTYDGDSIWNFFAGEPSSDLGLRAAYDFSDKIAVSAGGHGRLFLVETTPPSKTSSPNLTPTINPSYFPSNGASFEGGANLAARYRSKQTLLGLRSAGNFGEGGDRVGGEVFGERSLTVHWVVEGRTSVYQWNDKLRPGRDAASFGYVGGLGYRFTNRSQVLGEFEQNANRLVGTNVRAMLWLSLAVAP